jgi:urease accessory protein
MPRATAVIAASHGQGHEHGHGHGREQAHERKVADTVILDYAQRSAGKVSVTSVKGLTVDIDLHEPARLRTDDLLVIEDGTFIEVVAAPEPLLEVRAADVAALARLAWHLGDRHLPVQILPNRVRVQRDDETERLLKALGAKLLPIEAPFDPEGGAYHAAHDLGHHHHHDHDHGHAHGHRQG